MRIGIWSNGASDELAMERRAFRFAEFQAAATVLRALQG